MNAIDQLINTLNNYGCRPIQSLASAFILNYPFANVQGEIIVAPLDARNTIQVLDIWFTDPPYADAVNYHEITEYFLAWYEKPLRSIFPDWYTDSRRSLAVKGSDINFRSAMVESYHRLTEHMPDNGMQIVMFTHQDAAVWADLTLIFWAAGLRVTAAWTIATETD